MKPFNERELRATIEIAFYTHQMERTLADERAKRRGAEEFKVLVDGVRDYAIFMLDGHGRVTTWNSGAERLRGTRREEIVGKDFSVFYTEEDRQAGHPKRLLDAACATDDMKKRTGESAKMVPGSGRASSSRRSAMNRNTYCVSESQTRFEGTPPRRRAA